MYDVVTNILDNARVELPGVTDAMVSIGLFNALDEFCRRSDANRFNVQVPLTEGVQEYYITFPDTVVIRIFEIIHPNMDTQGAWYDPDDGKLTLPRAPDVNEAMEPVNINMSFAPKVGVTDIAEVMPELIWHRFYNTLIDGVISKCAAQIAKPWTHERKATYHGKRFRNGTMQAKAMAQVGFAPDSAGWRYPTWTR